MQYKSCDQSPANDYGGRWTPEATELDNTAVKAWPVGRFVLPSKAAGYCFASSMPKSEISYSVELRCNVRKSDNARDSFLSSVKLCAVVEVLPSSPSSPGDSIVIGGSA